MKRLSIAVATLALASVPSFGHHSFAAEYDSQKPITLQGTVVHMEWINPHSWLKISVVGADGQAQEWVCETAPPNMLYRAGWRPSSLKEGDKVTVEGFGAKDSSRTMSTRSVTTADGKKMFSGQAQDAPAAK